jgi:hypothetical protein
MSAQNAASMECGDGLELGRVTVIGVIADPSDHDVVREFFELFKTPWEFCRPGRSYDVVLCAIDGRFDETAKVILHYSGRKTRFDKEQGVRAEPKHSQTRVFTYRGHQIPIYGDCVTFPASEKSLLAEGHSLESSARLDRSEQQVTARIGYDLFYEIHWLLTAGQPAVNAGIPTLELHIAFLRNLIVECGISLVEIPPVPEGYGLIACLTHDVDHPSIRQHKWDHTAFGFLYRASFGSLAKLLRGRMSMRDFVNNWWTALKLPLVYLGVAKDFWSDFGDRYLELEEGIRSTFFVIPFKNRPGDHSDGSAPKFRAASYCAAEIADTIRKLGSQGCEVGLHGIDAWCDSSQGGAELAEIRRLTGASDVGVRMHWLYYNQQSPSTLERAEAAYDSTVGYNETVGYRAGTTQAYKPFPASRLLELPLHVMDTALFYPAHLGLSPREAKEVVATIADNATKFGGCITVNWHDRSLAPERLWDKPYRDLVQDLKSRGAWFATAGEAVSWFRKRRSVVFERDSAQTDGMTAKFAVTQKDDLPGLQLRINKGVESRSVKVDGSGDHVDWAFDRHVDAAIPLWGRQMNAGQVFQVGGVPE